jgi:diaminohydroxyphosphoribosylaminopyrimidine deaminase / 5-amino-6-(5-phosphoribosylamino)uracil reductase
VTAPLCSRRAEAVALAIPTPPPAGLRGHVEEHAEHMGRALELAERGWGQTSPNPMVGAVLVQGGSVVGEGWHEGPGTAHAEAMALATAGSNAKGATLYCTLEPCDHTGRTGPCTRSLIDAGIARAFIAAGDPNPIVDGRGFRALQEAGVQVHSGLSADRAHRLNEAFECHVMTGLPFVALKMASSLDGKTAATDGTSKWVTGGSARADVQRLRAWSDAVVVGAGTALADDPALSLRDPRFSKARAPVRVLVDTAGRVPATGRMFDGVAPTLVATSDRASDERVDEWTRAGSEVLVLPRDVGDGVSLVALIEALGKRDAQAVLVEGGPTLAWSFVRDGLVDKIVLYMAPKLIGGAAAPGVLMGAGSTTLGEALALKFDRVERIGEDLKVEAYVHRDR